MSEPTIETPSGRTLVNLVKVAQIRGLLMDSASKVLTREDRTEELMQVIRGVASEVAYIVGDPPPEEKAERAAWCVALGVAASLEFSLLPNQQTNSESRGSALQAKYLAVKAELAGPARSGTGGPVARFSYPPPAAWPDQRRW